MSNSLKESNKATLVAVVVANVAVYISLLNERLDFGGVAATITDIDKLGPALLVAALVGVLSVQISHANKARLVFWRWSDPLPGSRAFSEYLDVDPRIDSKLIQRIVDPLPSDPNEQNALWYKWYREVQSDPSISQVHREYLFARDYTSLSVLFVFTLGSLAIWQMDFSWALLAYVSCLVLQYLIVRRAAYSHGLRFVTTVMALKATQA